MMANVWKHVAAHYATNEREDIFFELLNEPDMSNGEVESATWRIAAQEDIDSIRKVDTKHTIIFGDAKWYDITLLSEGAKLNDDNIIYAVHTYDPFVFTHQNANWAATKTIKNLMFPYDKEKWSEYTADFGVTKATESWVRESVKDYYKTGNKEYILKTVLPAKEWAVKNNVPVIINEFGAYNLKTDKQSVLNYMTAMKEISDTLQIPLTHWGYTGGFALFESEKNSVKGTKLIEGMDEAFGLKK
jgi:licheninase